MVGKTTALGAANRGTAAIATFGTEIVRAARRTADLNIVYWSFVYTEVVVDGGGREGSMNVGSSDNDFQQLSHTPHKKILGN